MFSVLYSHKRRCLEHTRSAQASQAARDGINVLQEIVDVTDGHACVVFVSKIRLFAIFESHTQHANKKNEKAMTVDRRACVVFMGKTCTFPHLLFFCYKHVLNTQTKIKRITTVADCHAWIVFSCVRQKLFRICFFSITHLETNNLFCFCFFFFVFCFFCFFFLKKNNNSGRRIVFRA